MIRNKLLVIEFKVCKVCRTVRVLCRVRTYIC